ncbi:putative nuclease HARBI1 [Ischnura elegans]|uniref:putative nuclease HARBI1 n=1 Tax=Ischnura elegans TaxID=197161 RepID=UPI001ED887F7|nr:putative nuclease HARBI1 [Ischnura elegans]
MDNDNANIARVAFCVGVVAAVLQGRRRNRRRLWSREWLSRRYAAGSMSLLYRELETEDPESFTNFLRMDNNNFRELLELVSPLISKRDTILRECISAKHRLAVTLRFLATGESYKSLQYSTRIAHNTISLFVPQVCRAIYEVLKENFLKMPRSVDEWEEIAREFQEKWNFPNCIGALDGKHIHFRSSRADGSFYFNYKGSHSIVLLALVDARYKCLYIDVGVNGRVSDGGVFRESTLAEALRQNSLHIPPNIALPGRVLGVPHVIVADDAFPLQYNIMKPYPDRGLSLQKRNFNYRLSRARRTSENAFGILANRFRILLNCINLSVEKVEIVTLACIVLHNFLRSKKDANYLPQGLVDRVMSDGRVIPGVWREGPILDGQLVRQGGNRHNNDARAIRDEICEYFVTDGILPLGNGM